jgi:ADP-heptose:LPS heptosyltransferase
MLSVRYYIAIEPNGKTDYFGHNRLWFFERWQLLVDRLSESSEIIQVGGGTGSSLENVKDLSGKLTFRETAWVISQSKLFVGTIGGLMHAARAVEIKSVILYSGTEKVDMAGYSENVNLIMPVDCSPCGFKIE